MSHILFIAKKTGLWLAYKFCYRVILYNTWKCILLQWGQNCSVTQVCHEKDITKITSKKMTCGLYWRKNNRSEAHHYCWDSAVTHFRIIWSTICAVDCPIFKRILGEQIDWKPLAYPKWMFRSIVKLCKGQEKASEKGKEEDYPGCSRDHSS